MPVPAGSDHWNQLWTLRAIRLTILTKMFNRIWTLRTFRRPLGSKHRFIFVSKFQKWYKFDPRTSSNQLLIAKLAELSYFQPELLMQMQLPNLRTYFGHLFLDLFYEVLCAPMDAPWKVSIDFLSFSPRSQTSDRTLSKHISKLGMRAILGWGNVCMIYQLSIQRVCVCVCQNVGTTFCHPWEFYVRLTREV